MRQLLACTLLPVLVSLHGCSSSSNNNVDDDPCEVATLVSDAWSGIGSGDPRSITAVDGKLYYQANDGVHGEELWVYDPATGASLLADIVPGSGGGDPRGLTVLDGELYFSANDEILGRELWRYDIDDPTAGASLIADINPGSLSSGPGSFIALGDKLFFVAYDEVHGSEPRIFDPESGVALLADTRPGERGAFIGGLVILNDKLYFTGHDGDGIRLWVYDPSAAALSTIDVGTVLMSFGGGPSQLTVFDEKLFFTANGGVSGDELWVYDEVNGATLAADINIGSGSSDPYGMTILDGKLYLAADDGVTGDELWVYDPATGGATLVADIYPGSSPGLISETMVVMDGRLYFVARDDVNGRELREYDPQSGEIKLIADIVPGVGGIGDDDPEPPSDLMVFDGTLYFSAHNGEAGRVRALWSYTPITGPLMINEAWPGTGITRMPRTTTELDDLVYFSVDDGVHGYELWVYDGACAGT